MIRAEKRPRKPRAVLCALGILTRQGQGDCVCGFVIERDREQRDKTTSTRTSLMYKGKYENNLLARKISGSIVKKKKINGKVFSYFSVWALPRENGLTLVFFAV